jgi:transposase
MSVAEQRYLAVLAVIADGHDVVAAAQQWGVSRQTLHTWMGRYEADGLAGLADRSHRPWSCPHQMPPLVEAAVLELRRVHPAWGPRRIVVELARRGVVPVPSESGVYRALTRAGLIVPGARRRRRESWKRWERGAPMELWQMGRRSRAAGHRQADRRDGGDRQQGGRPPVTLPWLGMTKVITQVDALKPSAFGIVDTWRTASGFAHGRSWAALGYLEKETTSTGHTGIVQLRLTNRLDNVLWVTWAAYDLIRATLQLFQRRARSPYT